MTSAPILAIGDRTNNAQAIADCVTLGYLDDDMVVADVTYGLGKFWKQWRPADDKFYASDLNPDRSPAGRPIDFRDTGYPEGFFDGVVIDPRFKLSGRTQSNGPARLNDDYGVGDEYQSVKQIMDTMYAGLTEAARIVQPGGRVLFKCQAQVNAGRVVWQPSLMAAHGLTHGLVHTDTLFVRGHRKQTSNHPQQHARRDYSELLILTKKPSKGSPT